MVNKLQKAIHIIHKKRTFVWLTVLIMLIGNMVSPASHIEAQDPDNTVTINDFTDLKSAMTTQTQDTVIYLSDQINTVLSNEITLTGMTVNNNIIIDGSQLTGELTAAPGKKHITISNAGTGTITLRNIMFKGLRTEGEIASQTAGSGGGGVVLSQGTYILDNTYFHAINGNGISGNATKTIVNSTFENNFAGNGAAINVAGVLVVYNCSFDNNYGNGGGYSGGAICFNGSRAEILNSVFVNNQSSLRGGAFASHLAQNGAQIKIDNCYFENNDNTVNSTYQSSTHDGGAVSIFGQSGTSVKFELLNSTFYNNHAADDGGAVFIENWYTGASNRIVNCTILGNQADNQSTSLETGGGAIQLSLETPCTIENSTIIQNYTKNTTGSGAGIGFHNDSTLGRKAIATLKNNIILGNYGTGTNGNSANVGASIYGSVIDAGGNIRIDNGTSIPSNVNLINVFGSGSPKLTGNGSKIAAGNPNDAVAGHYLTVPTVPILPNDGTDVLGLADHNGVQTDVMKDQRGFDRALSGSDTGAVEILWVKFHANGGKWSALPDFAYNGTEYYVKNTDEETEYFYKISDVDGKAVFPADPQREGYTFIGWNTSPDGAGSDYLPHEELIVNTDSILYAQWEQDEPIPTPTATPTETATEEPTVTPAETPTEEPVVTPTETATEDPTVTPAETATEEPVVTPTETATEEPVITSTGTTTEESTVTPTETATDDPTLGIVTSTPGTTSGNNVTELPTETVPVTQSPEEETVSPTQSPEETTASPVQSSTETPIWGPTNAPTNYSPDPTSTNVPRPDPDTGEHSVTFWMITLVLSVTTLILIKWKTKPFSKMRG